MSFLHSPYLFAASGKSFTFDLGASPETLGDIKPAILNFKQETIPNISIKEVIRRYRQLFDKTTDPVVKIDALQRMTDLENKFGDKQDMTLLEEKKLYKKAIHSYELIVNSGIYYKRVDELLYQTAKAYDFTGRYKDSIRSLRQLVGLYPHSRLVTESFFRIGEASFSLGKYKEAEAAYQQVLNRSKSSKFYGKSLFMLGWSQFKQAHYNQSSLTFVKVLDRALQQSVASTLSTVSPSYKDTVNDTLRVLAITFSYQKGAEGIEKLIKQVGKKPYTFDLYQHLAKLYIKQERYEDSASTSRTFMNQYPDNPNVPLMAVSVIDAYKKGHFAINVWEEKAKYVDEFGINSARWLKMPLSTREDVRPYLIRYLKQLSHLNYIRAQKQADVNKRRNYYKLASRYYIEQVRTNPTSKSKGKSLFLAGESLFQIKDFSAAIKVYRESAYHSPLHKNAAEAGYAAIVAYNMMKKAQGHLSSKEQKQRHQTMMDFANAFSFDPRSTVVLNDLANEALQSDQFKKAITLSNRVLTGRYLTPRLKLSSFLVNGYGNFETGHYQLAEESYSSALHSTVLDTKQRVALRERLAASIYRRAEQLAKNGDDGQAVINYLRVGKVVPESPVRVNAYFDAATLLMKDKHWLSAIKTLNDFQKMFPESSLNKKIPEKLIYANLQSGNKIRAAELFLNISNTSTNKEKARSSLYQSAELFSEGGDKVKSSLLLKKYIANYPKPYNLNIEAQQKLVDYYASIKARSKKFYWLRRIIRSDKHAGADRTERGKFLAVSASMELANFKFDRYKRIKLKLPLKKSLLTKRKAMKSTITAYEKVAAYGVIQFTTEATYQLAAVYKQLSIALMKSDKPKKLTALQLEQYNLLLEEQAYPFEEKAIKLYKMNVERAQNGVFDNWIKESYRQLSKIVPASYRRPVRRFDNVVPIN